MEHGVGITMLQNRSLSIDGNSHCAQCACLLSQVRIGISVEVKILQIEGSLVMAAMAAHRIDLNFSEVSDHLSGQIEIPPYMEQPHRARRDLCPGALTYRARREIGGFEFIPVTVPLIERLKRFRSVRGTVRDVPQADDGVVPLT